MYTITSRSVPQIYEFAAGNVICRNTDIFSKDSISTTRTLHAINAFPLKK
jgi:hypothetical protein